MFKSLLKASRYLVLAAVLGTWTSALGKEAADAST
jgi:hypothetical protein